MKNRATDLPLIYLWMRLQLSDYEAERYRQAMPRIFDLPLEKTRGLDIALREAAEHIARMEDI